VAAVDSFGVTAHPQTETVAQTPAGRPESQQRLAYIHCLRGYAVLLVITTHVTYVYPELPYPVHRITAQGLYGVQLFFLASAITLMRSWHSEPRRTGTADVGAFFIRRFFRIVPAYYAGALVYYFVRPPVMGFSVAKLVPWLVFLNAWHPTFQMTALGAWEVVPGGWSISAEFSFYFAFPAIALVVTSARRAIWFLFLVCAVTAVVNTFAYDTFMQQYPRVAVEDFMYFYAPNQAPVFALGILVYFGLAFLESPRFAWLAERVKSWRLILCAAGAAAVVSPGYLAMPKAITLNSPFPSTVVVVSVGFTLVVIALSVSPPGVLVNRWVAYVGEVSFSAYIVHFGILDLLTGPLAGFAGLSNQRYAAIACFAAAWVAVVAATVLVSTLTYRFIEVPGIALGRQLILRRRAMAVLHRGA
jgi:peptidoglycan/LPS O-acetylase OafA/YrhL